MDFEKGESRLLQEIEELRKETEDVKEWTPGILLSTVFLVSSPPKRCENTPFLHLHPDNQHSHSSSKIKSEKLKLKMILDQREFKNSIIKT